MWLTGPVSMFVMFPIVLMLTLETNSMFGVLSWPVLRTLRTTTDAWLKFYMTAGAMIVAAVALCWAASAVNVVAGVIVGARSRLPPGSSIFACSGGWRGFTPNVPLSRNWKRDWLKPATTISTTIPTIKTF